MTTTCVKIPKVLCDFTVATAIFLSSVSPVVAGTVKAPPAGVGAHRVIHVTTLVMNDDLGVPAVEDMDKSSERFVAYETVVYNAHGTATERMTCMTQLSPGDPENFFQVVVNINGKKGQIGYTADYKDGKRRSVILVRDNGPKSDTLATNSRRLAALNYHLPDESRDNFQTPEGPISRDFHDACADIITEAKGLDSTPQANHASIHVDGPRETHSYVVPLTPTSPTARGIFLKGGSQYGYFLKELGLK
ncbi:MAG: hypothetical protein PHD48_10560 [Alphaproteobacteria bacterium]|nr:hypothetical protein [Alphaproteobacteria bacterium]